MLIVALATLALVTTGCPDDSATGSGEAEPRTGASPAATQPPNRPPEIVVDSYLQQVGSRLDEQLVVSDPDGTVTRIEWNRPPPGFAYSGGAERAFSWTPPLAGTWRVEVTATDDAGASSSAVATFISRYPQRQHTLVGLGDSVAAGFGLDLTDALLGDPCWRAPADSYPKRVMDLLVEAEEVPQAQAEVVLVACSGSSTGDVWESATWFPPDAPAGIGESDWSQLDWAIQLNPGYVTLTVGANDLGVVDLSILAGGELDDAELARRLENVAGGVGYLLDELLDRTDAQIVLTNYYNPTAVNPTGLEGCRGECFVELADVIHNELNRVLAGVADRYRARVSLADVATLYEGHEAGDALGPNWLREPIETLLGVQVRAYCSEEDPGESWVSSIDCVHPTGAGMSAIAGEVAAVFGAARG